MDKKIKFRKLKTGDIPVFCQMLMNIWQLRRCPQTSRLGKLFSGLLYVLSILEETEKLWVADDGKAVGFCGYGIGKDKKIYIWLRKTLLSLLPIKDQKLYQRYYKISAYGNLHASEQNAEITILIVAPQYYGKGLGSQLVEKIQTEVFSKGGASVFALTDSGCHWHFYEKQGFKKVFEQEAAFGDPSKPDEIQYIFQKNLQ